MEEQPEIPPPKNPPPKSSLLRKDDWWAIWIGGFLLAACLSAVLLSLPSTPPAGADAAARDDTATGEVTSALKGWFNKPGGWSANPLHSVWPESGAGSVRGLLGTFVTALVLFAVAVHFMEGRGRQFAAGFPLVFVLAVLAFVLAGQSVIKYYSLSYALWALVTGLLISNTVGTPAAMKPAVRTELYIKTGLVILGAEVLFSKLLALGVPGIFVAWVVTPTVLISTFWFGQRILKITSPSLNMVISADMSVCGVSAAIATAAACRAKKEELSVAIGLSLTFTVIMMVVMPAIITATGMSPVLGGAWMGGTIDATGAVGAAGAILGDDALTVATTVKMIQNILIGVVAFCVALYWIRFQTPEEDGVKPSAAEIWHRFPKFVLGFVVASVIFSLVYSLHGSGQAVVGAVISDTTKNLRGWFFGLAFISIGLESNFRELSHQLRGGKPLVLYVVGQSLNLCLTLFMAWLMFELIFPGAADVLRQ